MFRLLIFSFSVLILSIPFLTHPNTISQAIIIPDQQPNYTLALKIEPPTGQFNLVPPTIADLDGDDQNELIAGTTDGQVIVWQPNNPIDWSQGVTIAPGFPVIVTDTNVITIPEGTTGTEKRVFTGPLAVGDLDQNGDLEIVGGVGNDLDGAPGDVYVWNHDGTVFEGWPQQLPRFGDVSRLVVNTLALGDVDGDLDLEIIAGTNNNLVNTDQAGDPDFDVPDLFVWHHTGELVDGWPAADGPAVQGNVAIADLNQDGTADILTGRDYHRLFAYDGSGENLPGWSEDGRDGIGTFVLPSGTNENDGARVTHKFTGPVIADMEDDGVYEYIAVGMRRNVVQAEFTNSDATIYTPDAQRKAGWEIPAAGSGLIADNPDINHAPAIGDLDGDGVLDFVTTTQDGRIRAYSVVDAQGNPAQRLLWEVDYTYGEIIYGSPPVIGDVDNDGKNEVLFGTYDPNRNAGVGPLGLWVLEDNGLPKGQPQGNPVLNAPEEEGGIRAAPALIDLDGDGLLEIVTSSLKQGIYIWETGQPYYADRMPWPVSRHDVRRTGFYETVDFNVQKSVEYITTDFEQPITYTIKLLLVGQSISDSLRVTNTVPSELNYIPGTLTATFGTVDESNPSTLGWSSPPTQTRSLLELTYVVTVAVTDTIGVTNTAIIEASTAGRTRENIRLLLNPERIYVPTILKIQ